MFETLSSLLTALAWFVGAAVPLSLGGMLACWLVNTPLRRQENARFFLDILALGLRNGAGPERTIVALSHTGDRDLGGRFHLIATFLESGCNLLEAIRRAPQVLPPRIMALLRIGSELGELSRILPAAQSMLNDGSAAARKAKDYFVTLAFIITPAVLATVVLVQLFVIPKYESILVEMMEGAGYEALWFSLTRFNWIWAAAQLILLAAIWTSVLIYWVNPVASSWEGTRIARWCSAIQFAIPWRRKRMQRDFAAALGLLLDAGVPEERAITLAADCAENLKFIARARWAVARLKNGAGLIEALVLLDPSRQFEWRLRTATAQDCQAQRALDGWREELDALAFQQEQTFTHAFTSGLAIWNGITVGIIAIAVFVNLTRMIDHASPW